MRGPGGYRRAVARVRDASIASTSAPARARASCPSSLLVIHPHACADRACTALNIHAGLRGSPIRAEGSAHAQAPPTSRARHPSLAWLRRRLSAEEFGHLVYSV
eukprot:5835267-Prymnesium_polylepis.1